MSYIKTPEHREKLRQANLGKKYSKERIDKMIKKLKGRKLSDEHKKKISNSEKGKNHYNWKGGITPLSKRIKKSYRYIKWRSDIFTRDNWTCQTCREKGCFLEVHHIKAFSIIIKECNIDTIDKAEKCEELWDINNGITLCKECHKLTENYKGRLNKKKRL